jgi:O-antigen/teichoic acid export membrane protein
VCLLYGNKIGFRTDGILDREAYSAVGRFSFPIFLLALPNVVHGRSPQIIYPYFGGTPALLAIFIAASRVSSALNGFFAGLNANMIKEVARVPESNRRDSEDLYKKITRWGGYVMLPTATVMIVGAPQVMGLFGTGFTEGASVLIILLIGEILNGMLGPSGNLLNMRGHGNLSFKISLLMLVVYLAPSPIIIKYFGLLGFAVWLSVIKAFWAFLLSFSVKCIFGFWPFTPQFFALFVGTTLLTFGFTLTPADLTLFPPFALIAVSIIVLIGLTFFIAMTHDEDRHLIKKILKRLKIYAPS